MTDHAMNQKHIVLPAVIRNEITGGEFPWHAYVMLVCEIPAGKVASIEDIMKCLTEAYGMEFPLERSAAEQNLRSTDSYPYWRVVSQRGHILYSNKGDSDLAKLESEGVEVLEPNPELDSKIVKDFKEKRFTFSGLKISVQEPDQEVWKKMQQYKNR